jgi:hypothetical protein
MTPTALPPIEPLSQEWLLLQQQDAKHEQQALTVRIVAVLLYLAGWGLGLDSLAAAVLTLLFWMQEAMIRAWQNRAGERLLRIESLLRGEGARSEGTASPAFQLHSEWMASRRGTMGLLREYAAHAARPTVAFFYIVLLALLAAPGG